MLKAIRLAALATLIACTRPGAAQDAHRRRLWRLVRADDAQGRHSRLREEARRQGRVRRRQLDRHAGQAAGAEGQPADRRRHRRRRPDVPGDPARLLRADRGPADKSDLYPAALFKDDKAVAVGLVGTGFMYNTKTFKEKGWAPPTSWNDLKDPKFKKLLVIPPINNTYGLYTLVMFARDERRRREEHRARLQGDEGRDQPERAGLRAVARQDDRAVPERPGVRSRCGAPAASRPSPTPASRSTSSIRRKARRSLLASACPVAKAERQSRWRRSSSRCMVSAPVQTGRWRAKGLRPGQHQGRRQHAGRCKMAPVGDARQADLRVDWDAVNAKRDDWTKRWNREVER